MSKVRNWTHAAAFQRAAQQAGWDIRSGDHGALEHELTRRGGSLPDGLPEAVERFEAHCRASGRRPSINGAIAFLRGWGS